MKTVITLFPILPLPYTKPYRKKTKLKIMSIYTSMIPSLYKTFLKINFKSWRWFEWSFNSRLEDDVWIWQIYLWRQKQLFLSDRTTNWQISQICFIGKEPFILENDLKSNGGDKNVLKIFLDNIALGWWLVFLVTINKVSKNVL